jgi:hypothetical protein
MSAGQTWKIVFTAWPASIPRRGTVVNSLNESIPFKAFMVKDDCLLLERTNPDQFGARFILTSFEAVHSVKFVDPLKESVFTAAGFAGKLSQ